MKRLNLVGKKFNKLTVIEFSCSKNRKRCFLCKCDCGNKVVVQTSNLTNGHTKSCGCLATKNSYKHGMIKTQFYKIWCGIKERCLNPHKPTYKNYGGRGISVCEHWLDFQGFMDDMYQSYQQHVSKFGEKQTTIDRIDNDKGYCKENCRWATYKKQANNKRNNRLITYKNKTLTMKQWAEELNINYQTLSDRINTRKLSINDAFKN